MGSLIKRRPSTFLVDFGNVDIPSNLAAELETNIQEMALGALARIDFRGDIRIGRLPPGTYGMIFGDWPPDLLSGLPEQPEQPDIKIRDHTLIIEAVMQNGLALTRILANERKNSRRVSGATVLEGLLILPSVDSDLKHKITTILSYMRDNAKLTSNLSREAKAALSEMTKLIDSSQSVEETESFLDQFGRDGRLQKIDGVALAVRIASEIFKDGRATIYSPEYPFYDGMRSDDGIGTIAQEKGASDVAKEDVKGGVTGAMGGSVAGPKGALLGGVGGALLGSAAEAISQLWDSIFD